MAMEPGLYQVEGLDPKMGAYSGVAQVLGDRLVRKIKYRDFTYNNYSVELIWTGVVSGDAVLFKVRKSQNLTKFEDYELSPDRDLEGFVIRSVVRPNGELDILGSQEKWVHTNKNPGEHPLWVSERYQILSRGETDNLILDVVKKLGLGKVFVNFTKWAQASPLSDRLNISDNHHWHVYDPTDYLFYQNDKTTIRVTNKYINPLSLAEALTKRNAYAPSLAEKAKFFEEETQKYNLNEVGLLEIAHINENKEKVKSEVEGDAALWTGVYVWSQALRFKQDKDPQALKNIRLSLQGLITLIEITDNSEEFARTLIVSPPGETALGDRLNQGTGPYSNIKWQNTGNNDMIKGIFLAFAVAYPILEENDPLKILISKKTDRLLNLKAVKERDYNLGIAYGLKALYQNDKSVFEDYSNRLLNLLTWTASELNLTHGFHFESIADWSGIHLTTITSLSQVILSQQLEKKFPRNSLESYLAKKIKQQAQERLFKLSETYRSARRDFLTIVAHTFSPEARKSAHHQKRVQQALWSLKEVPAPRFVGHGVADQKRNSDWSLSRWPALPWKLLKGPFRVKDEKEFENRIQGIHSYPIFEALSWGSPYLWKEAPFRVIDESPKNKIYFSADYLILYRIAREGGLIKAGE